MSAKKFCQIVRKRSAEHAEAMERLHGLPGIMASIIRQELDSMIRVLYLLTISEIEERERLIEQTINGEKWTTNTEKGKTRNITDCEMVEISDKFFGWTASVYKFGCAFIHLSNFHNYSEENPFDRLDEFKRHDVLNHMRQYHDGPETDNPSFEELASYFPAVFKKVSQNLECYLEVLEENNTPNLGHL